MNTLSITSHDYREFRRLRAVELLQAGWQAIDIAEALGVTRGAVSQWVKKLREQGISALRSSKVAKKPCKLSQDQLDELVAMLRQGPESFGYAGQAWTHARICELIERKFGVKYHPDYIGQILKKCGWTYQKPKSQATQRDDKAVEHWCNEQWPDIKKKPMKKKEK